jgi:predicted nuclease of predicted toxin-antitoxin system
LSEIRFYLDENIDKAVTEQLLRWGIDAVSVHTLELRGDSDINHLQRATDMGRALCTHDQDFTRLAAENTEHAGIVFAQQYQASVGGWVRSLRALHARMSAEEIRGMLIFVSLK